MVTQRTGHGRLLPHTALLALAIAAIVVASCSNALSPRVALRVQAYDLSASEFLFGPDPLGAPALKPVTLEFVNSSAEPHNLVLLAPIDTRTDHDVPPGQTRMLEFVTPAGGTYRFVCTIHEGMTGTLLVR